MAHQMMLVCEAPGCSIQVPVQSEDVFAPGWVTRQVYTSNYSADFEEEMFCSDVCELTVLQARADAATMIVTHEATEAASEARKPCWGCGKIDCPLWIDPDEWQKDREEGE